MYHGGRRYDIVYKDKEGNIHEAQIHVSVFSDVEIYSDVIIEVKKK